MVTYFKEGGVAATGSYPLFNSFLLTLFKSFLIMKYLIQEFYIKPMVYFDDSVTVEQVIDWINNHKDDDRLCLSDPYSCIAIIQADDEIIIKGDNDYHTYYIASIVVEEINTPIIPRQRDNDTGWFTDLQIIALLNQVQVFSNANNNQGLLTVTGDNYGERAAHILNCYLTSKSTQESLSKFRGPLLTDYPNEVLYPNCSNKQ
jgi:hypothetical protein